MGHSRNLEMLGLLLIDKLLIISDLCLKDWKNFSVSVLAPYYGWQAPYEPAGGSVLATRKLRGRVVHPFWPKRPGASARTEPRPATMGLALSPPG
jgi:hypothetical protein